MKYCASKKTGQRLYRLLYEKMFQVRVPFLHLTPRHPMKESRLLSFAKTPEKPHESLLITRDLSPERQHLVRLLDHA